MAGLFSRDLKRTATQSIVVYDHDNLSILIPALILLQAAWPTSFLKNILSASDGYAHLAQRAPRVTYCDPVSILAAAAAGTRDRRRYVLRTDAGLFGLCV
jgi:hypothetical protein